MNQPLVPNLETGTEIREHIQPMCSLYRRLIAVMLDVMRRIDLDVMRRIDVVPVIEEMHATEPSTLFNVGGRRMVRNHPA
jgi:hypothetical protein